MQIEDYDKIPDDLRWECSWLLAGPDEKGRFKVPHSFGARGMYRVDPTDQSQFRDMETIIELSVHYKCGLGFSLTEKDTFTCIDLDIKNENNEPDETKWTTQEQINRFQKIIETFDSYTERSASGQGFHIWVRGKIGAGCKRDGVEVYSQDRFIVCTGNVVLDKEIENRQELLDILVGEIRRVGAPQIDLTDLEQSEDDETILERARTADNAEKFYALYNGDWDGYPSQSEADLALLSIFAFYSKSNTQVRRLFRTSGLAHRAKATKNDTYLNRTLRIIRSREAVEDEIDSASKLAGERILASILASTPGAKHEEDEEFDYSVPTPKLDFDPVLAQLDPPPDEAGTLAWPPGMVGSLASAIYEGAPRPVKEVAIVAALGLMAGICGKAFTIPQSGLNLYIVLIARSAIGKEAMHSGIATIVKGVMERQGQIQQFVSFADYASGPALMKTITNCTNNATSFVNVAGEFGRKLRRLSMEERVDGPMQQLRTVMTNLYQKSGPESMLGGLVYADDEKNKNNQQTGPVAFSMIGESTPGTFFDSLTDSMMEDGFLSRFIIIEYTGDRPFNNTATRRKPSAMLLDHIASIVKMAVTLNDRSEHMEVQPTFEAANMLSAFDKECDKNIKSTDNEGFRQMWNRAHLKVCRIAALLAVGDNPLCPTIEKEHIEWAISVIRRDIGIMNRRMNSGDVGIGDAPRERKLYAIIKRYVMEETIPASYGVPQKMKIEMVIPRKYLQIATQAVNSFTSHRMGQNVALDMAIKSLIDNGSLVEMDKVKAFELFGFQGKCYRILWVPPRDVTTEASAKNQS